MKDNGLIHLKMVSEFTNLRIMIDMRYLKIKKYRETSIKDDDMVKELCIGVMDLKCMGNGMMIL